MIAAFNWFLIKFLIRLRFPTVPAIAPATLADWLQHRERPQPLLLDTRTAAEYAVSHLAEAQRLDPQQATLESLAHLALDTPIVTYCSVGYRSAAIAQRLQQKGFTQVVNLEGSIFQWANEGRPVYRNGQVVPQVHPYNQKWGRLLRKELRADEYGVGRSTNDNTY